MHRYTNNSLFFTSKLLIYSLVLICLAGCAVTDLSFPRNSEKKVSDSALLLNTVVTITLYGTEDDALIEDCFDLCRKYEMIFSRTDERSELCRLNETHEAEVSDELLYLLQRALFYCALSDGAFDITLGQISDMYGFSSGTPAVPPAEELASALEHTGYEHIHIDGNTVTIDDAQTVIDLGAIAKGYIADRLAEHLTANGQNSAVIDLGGNVLCVGAKPDGSSFRVGIQYPFEERNTTIATIPVSGMSVVTSGIYERSFEQDGILYHHILDPETGYPCRNGLLAVSIVSPDSVDGDALSTVCFVLGLEKGLELINSMDGIEAVFVTEDYALHYSQNFEALYLNKE